MSAVSVSRLAKAFGATPVLVELDLDVPAGSLVAVLGASGCGKTTLLRVLAGFEPADRGSVRIGEAIVDDGVRRVAASRRRVGHVPQEGALFPHLDVRANIAFGLSRSERRDGARVAELIDLLGLAELVRRRPHELSGGQQQRVALARALAPRPSVVLLDEPFSALDPDQREKTRTHIRAALRELETTTILVTHDQDEALSLADRVALMRRGRIAQTGTPQDLYGSPADLETACFLGEAVLLQADMSDGYARSPLGRLAVRAPTELADGPVTIVLRPEQLTCRLPDGHMQPDGARGRVLSVAFSGHGATVEVVVDDTRGSSSVVTARAAAERLPTPGDEVAIAVQGIALAYPQASEPADGGPIDELDAPERADPSSRNPPTPPRRAGNPSNRRVAGPETE